MVLIQLIQTHDQRHCYLEWFMDLCISSGKKCIKASFMITLSLLDKLMFFFSLSSEDIHLSICKVSNYVYKVYEVTLSNKA